MTTSNRAIEKRQFTRHAISERVPVTIAVLSDRRRFDAVLVDLSLGGAQIELSVWDHVNVGESLCVEIGLRELTTPIKLEAIVRRAISEGGRPRLGIQFAGDAGTSEGRHRLAVALVVREGLGKIPAILDEALEIATSARARFDDLVDFVNRRPENARRLLDLAKVPAFAGTHRIDSLAQAVRLLGFRAVANVAIALLVLDLFPPNTDASASAAWTHSIACAHFAEQLAPEDPFAFSAGLLHDLGRLVLLQVFPIEIKRVVGATAGGMPVMDAERLTFGLAHDDVNAMICDVVDFPAPIAEVLRDHHLENPSSERVRVVQLGNDISNALAFAYPEPMNRPSVPLSRLGLLAAPPSKSEARRRITDAVARIRTWQGVSVTAS